MSSRSDIDIAQSATLRPISEMASILGLRDDEIEPWGGYVGKVRLSVLERVARRKKGKLILVTSMTPTPQGEGKTTVTIGLAQALSRMGKKTMAGIRQSSLGPTMGIKGGAAGGGYSQVLPMEEINVHFTGDMYAVSSAHNLLAAMVNNHMHHGNELHIDPRRVLWKRVMDMNDRSLRNIVVGLGGAKNGMPHESGFDITAASEVMAILCLAKDVEDLKQRLGSILVAYTMQRKPIYAHELGAVGAMAVLLKNAMKPNLVQTIEGTPAFVHGGPFANIAHGTSSLISTRMGLGLSDYFITEAGFGSDLGAEKFFNIVARTGKLKPDVGVVVATIRAIKHQGSGDPNPLQRGLDNLDKHLSNIQMFNVPAVVAINKFPGDTKKEHALVLEHCRRRGVPAAVVDVREKGGEGGEVLAEAVMRASEGGSDYHPIYPLDVPIREKMHSIATMIYGADRVAYSVRAEKHIRHIEEDLGLGSLPVCVSKTQYSLSDDPLLLGRPRRFRITVSDLEVKAGAGFVVPHTGTITTMPGLPRRPSAVDIDLDRDGKVSGLF